jgi:hypothetical protein
MVQRKPVRQKTPQAIKIITKMRLEAPNQMHAARCCVNADNAICAMCMNVF